MELNKALAGTDIDEVKAKHEKLSQVSQALGSAMYAAAAAENASAGEDSGAGSASSASNESADDDVVDAEYTVKN